MKRVAAVLMGMLLLAACAEKKTVVVTEGFVDATPWAKWIEKGPEIILVQHVDGQTYSLMRKEVDIFTELVTDRTGDARLGGLNSVRPAHDAAGELESIKRGFPSKTKSQVLITEPSKSRTVVYDVPSIDLWNRYERTVEQAQLTTLGPIIAQLETYVNRDTQQLAQVSHVVSLDYQVAQSDLKWLRTVMVPIIARLRTLNSSTTVAEAPAVDAKTQAKAKWTDFETQDLPMLSRVMEGTVIATAVPDQDGHFKLTGSGDLIARVTVAGRVLYFPAREVSGIRFANVRTLNVPEGN